MNYNKIFTKNIKNSFSNIGQSGNLKVSKVMNLLQDIAVEYSFKLKISSMDLAPQKIFWVISRYQIEINNIAKLNEDLSMSVWRSNHKNLYDLRWFKIETADKQEIANAVGAWVIIDKTTGSPRHLNKFMTKEMLIENKVDVKTFFQNLKIIDNADIQEVFKIRINDLDFNKHVNNSAYVEWAIEALPESILMNYQPWKINVTYLKESFYPGKILSKAQTNTFTFNSTTHHSIVSENKNLELARIQIIWKPI